MTTARETDPEEAFAAQGSRHRQQQSRSSGSTFRTYEAQPSTGVKMTPKIPPSFDGQSSWFEFEDLIDDWVNITTLSAEKLGPSLKNALTGNAGSTMNSFVMKETVRISRRRCAHTLSREQTMFFSGVSRSSSGPGAETGNLSAGSLVLKLQVRKSWKPSWAC